MRWSVNPDRKKGSTYGASDLPSGQSTGNYEYNQLGQLVGDANEGKYYAHLARVFVAWLAPIWRGSSSRGWRRS